MPSSCTTQTGIEGEQTPVIGPTWPCSLPQRSAHLARRPAAPPPSSRSAAQPSSRHAATSARRCGSHDALPLDRRPGVQQHPVLEPVDHLARRRDGHARAGARPRSRAAPPRWPPRSRSPCAPHARSSSATTSASPPPGGRQSTSTTSAPWTRTRVGERRQPDVDGAHALQHAGARVMPDLAHLAAAVRAAPGLRAKRELRLLDGLPLRRSTATTPRSSRHGDGQLVLCGEAIAPALLAADPFAAGAAAVATNVADVRAMGGRPLALVDTLVSPDRDARRARARRARVGGRAARRAGRRRAPDARRAARRCRPSAPAP